MRVTRRHISMLHNWVSSYTLQIGTTLRITVILNITFNLLNIVRNRFEAEMLHSIHVRIITNTQRHINITRMHTSTRSRSCACTLLNIHSYINAYTHIHADKHIDRHPFIHPVTHSHTLTYPLSHIRVHVYRYTRART